MVCRKTDSVTFGGQGGLLMTLLKQQSVEWRVEIAGRFRLRKSDSGLIRRQVLRKLRNCQEVASSEN